MATSVHDLLTALDARLDDLENTRLVPGAFPRVEKEWQALARASLRLLNARPSNPKDGARRLQPLLISMTGDPGLRPLPAPGTGLMAVATTIGCAADVMRVPTVTTSTTRDAASVAVLASLEAALTRAAIWTQRELHVLGERSSRQLVRLAGLDGKSSRPFALQAWRIVGPTDPGIDSAVARWENAAAEALANPRAVTQLGLQLAAADVALLCTTTNVVLERTNQQSALQDDPTSSPAALTRAAQAWRQAARWPDHLRLGGRSTGLRHASADLRQCLDETLRTDNEWKPARDLFAGTSPEQHLVVLHTGLQAAIRVGRHVQDALEQLTIGASRVWLDASHIPMPRYSVQKALDSLRWDWLPDPATYHSAEALHRCATDALTRLIHAAPRSIEAITASTADPGQVDNDGPWETVPTTLDPLRAAQERAQLAVTHRSKAAMHTIGR